MSYWTADCTNVMVSTSFSTSYRLYTLYKVLNEVPTMLTVLACGYEGSPRRGLVGMQRRLI